MNNKNFPVTAALSVWFLLALLAVLNGAFRIYIIIPVTGEYTGHILSSIIFSAVIILIAYLLMKMKKIVERKIQIQIGILWLLMTISFEFIFGHYVMNHPWEKLFHDYNLAEGRVWIFVLVATFFAPLVGGKIAERLMK